MIIINPCWLSELRNQSSKNSTKFSSAYFSRVNRGIFTKLENEKNLLFFFLFERTIYYGVSWLKNINKKNDDDNEYHQQKNIFSHCFIFSIILVLIFFGSTLCVYLTLTYKYVVQRWLSWTARQNFVFSLKKKY